MPQVIVVVPTLAADAALIECLEALGRQSWRDFQVVVVDNSMRRAARGSREVSAAAAACAAEVVEAPQNMGYGGAINLGARRRVSEYVAALNDDAAPHEGWLGALVSAMQASPESGMCASCVRMVGTGTIDSAGMLLAADGSSKQRGHGRPSSEYRESGEALFPSGSAALYRRAMLEETGWFDERFFLYCEDTDLGLRGRWAGWKCLYAADAVVEHRYSHSAGRASRLKAYYVERNRLAVIAKNFPGSMLAAAPWHTLARYWWHGVSALRGEGMAGRFQAPVALLLWYAVKAHLSLVWNLALLARQRREVRAKARLTAGEFRELLSRHAISAREVARL